MSYFFFHGISAQCGHVFVFGRFILDEIDWTDGLVDGVGRDNMEFFERHETQQHHRVGHGWFFLRK